MFFDKGFRSSLQTEFCQIFGRFFRVRNFRNHVPRLGFEILVFQMGCGILMPCGFLVEFWKIGIHPRTRGGCYVSTFGSGHDNFICIRVVGFLNSYSVFTSLVDVGCVPVNV